MAKRPKILSTSRYLDSKIQVVEKDTEEGLKIDGKYIEPKRDADTGAYYCEEAPYQVFGSLEELAKAVIDVRKEK